MRRLRANWEWLLSAALFLASIYVAVLFVRAGDFGMAGYFVMAAIGFAWAAIPFADARPSRDQVGEDIEGN